MAILEFLDIVLDIIEVIYDICNSKEKENPPTSIKINLAKIKERRKQKKLKFSDVASNL